MFFVIVKQFYNVQFRDCFMIIDCSEKNATKWVKSSAIVKPRHNRINVSIYSRLDNQVDFILGYIKKNKSLTI